MYGPYLTMAELKAKYPDEWVYLAHPTTTRNHDVTGGHVILHHRDRAEYLRLLDECPEFPEVRHFASWYLGEPEDDFELLPADVDPEPGAA
jgi:hypothetical protein